ncbi:MAG: NAD(P)H-dependent glycerol-3-phosphate dehydrogenase [Paracoccaceae bacterium]
MTEISVFGAGAFGTALAISLARDGRKVSLVSRDRTHATDMAEARENVARLPGFAFPNSLHPTASFRDAASICLIAVPTQMLAGFIAEHATALAARNLVACCKGIDITSGYGPTRVIQLGVPDAKPAILSGPSFAVDIAAGLPTALTIAADPATAEMLQTVLSTANLRLYRTSDVTGVELGGALKNIVAIASGVAIGAGLGESARASVITRGYAEMRRFAGLMGAVPDTLSGLSGFGDLVLTCTSEKSRNYAYGLAIGRGLPRPQGITVEGASTAKAVSNLAQLRKLDMPLTYMVTALVDEKLSVGQAIDLLLSRPLKEE